MNKKKTLIGIISLTLVIIVVLGTYSTLAQTETKRLPISVYSFAKAFDALIYNSNYETIAVDKNGKIIAKSNDAGFVIQQAINNNAKKIIIMPGKYIFLTTVIINKSGISIEGASPGGDLFFTSDSLLHGISNKMPVTIVADGIDAFVVAGKDEPVFGVTIKNLAITGTGVESVLADDYYTEGAGIKVKRAEVLRIQNVEVIRKHYGIYLYAAFTDYKDVIDVVLIHNVLLAYNVYGIYAEGWVSDVRMRNVFGYLNQLSLIKAYPQYDWILENIFSNGDAWNSVNVRDAPIYIGTHRHIEIHNVEIFGAKGENLCPVPLMWFDLDIVEDIEPDVVIYHAVLAETQSDAIAVDGSGGVLRIHDIRAGWGYMGGGGNITGLIVKNYSTNVTVYIIDGKVKTEQIIPFTGNVIAKRLYIIRNGGEGLTENSGTAIIVAGSSRVTVTHGLYKAPSVVIVTPYGNAKVWVENIGDTTFDIVTDTAPTTDITVSWYAETG